MPKIPGIAFDFGGGRTLVVPPLALGSLQLLQDRLAGLSSGSALAPDSIQAVIDATHAALLRNYPEITRDEVGQLLDVGNMHDAIACVLDVAGIKRKSAEDAAKNPAAQPVVQTPAPTGPA